jgi:hypothetical protein
MSDVRVKVEQQNLNRVRVGQQNALRITTSVPTEGSQGVQGVQGLSGSGSGSVTDSLIYSVIFGV